MKTNPSIPLTCYIRTLDEEARIGPVMEKVVETGAEVVVVDCGSTDGTRMVAQEAGARVIEKKWEGNGFQKRMGEDAASNDWMLDLDADEVPSPELQEEIRGLFANGEPEPGIYALKLVTVPPVPKGAVWSQCNIDHRNKLYHKSIVRMPAHAAVDELNQLPERNRFLPGDSTTGSACSRDSWNIPATTAPPAPPSKPSKACSNMPSTAYSAFPTSPSVCSVSFNLRQPASRFTLYWNLVSTACARIIRVFNIEHMAGSN